MNKDYYDILGVSKDADAKEIKAAHRRLVKQYHPDISKEENAEEKFKEIQTAFDTLSDPDKRAQYDRVGHDAFGQQSQYGGARPGGAGFQGYAHNMGNTANVQFIRWQEFPLYKKILWVLLLIVLGFFIVVGVVIFTIFSLIINIITSLFSGGARRT